ncbi:hypothetical protein CR513_16386, partial [Mucuna pruriens]
NSDSKPQSIRQHHCGLGCDSKLGTKLLFSITCHPQTDGQTEVSLKSLEEWLPHIEFTYNKVVNETTSHAPLELVYGFNPLSPLDLLPLTSVASMANQYGGLSKA